MMTQRTWNGPDPSDILLWSIVQAGHKAGKMFWSKLAQVGLTPTQFGVLIAVDKRPAISNADLAREIHVTPQSMSELLGVMTELAYITRDEADTKGKRISVALTDQGRAKLKECQSVIKNLEQAVRYSEDERSELTVLLQKFLNN